MLGKLLSGRYYIIRELGGGAFGKTYLAEDRQLPGFPQCVVKQLKPQATNPLTLQIARRLFDSEAEVLYKLGNHQQIPRLLAHFEENKEFYLVQELIEGDVLSLELRPGKRLSEIEVIAIVQDILEVLVFVHQHDVIHRDIKPANLIRRRQDGRIVLIDFGAVKTISTQLVNSQGQTNLTVAIGTPGYMPSEQSSGNPKLSSDIYAVGIVGIQALTGLLPNQLLEDPQTSEITWRNHIQVSSQLAKILDKMVRYDFRQRYQSATEVLQAFRDYVNQSKKKKLRAILWQALIGLGITAVVAILVLWIGSKWSNKDLLTYKNPVYAISIKYPPTWEKKEIQDRITGDIAIFTTPKENDSDTFQEQLQINVEDLSAQPMSLDEYTNSTIKRIENDFPDANIVESSSGTLAKLPSYTVVYSGKEEKHSLKRMQVWTVKNNKAYIITYTAESDKYSNLLRPAQEMIKSFEID